MDVVMHRRSGSGALPPNMPLIEPPSAFPQDVAYLVAISVEFLLYGAYTCLFLVSVYIMLEKRSVKTTPGKIFLLATLFIYLITTMHTVLNFYRLIQVYALLRDSIEPYLYFLDATRWENCAHYVILCLITWVGDALVIYRCFIIWNGDYYVIAIPALLLIAAFVINVVVLHSLLNLNFLPFEDVVHLLNTIYPINFVQNTLTTGLIAFKIWNQHRYSAAAGVRKAGSSLFTVARIIVESAALYTIELLGLIILYYRAHNAQFILQYATVPTIGIVFNLIAVRVHLSQSRAPSSSGILSDISNWSDGHDDPTNDTMPFDSQDTDYTEAEGKITTPTFSPNERSGRSSSLYTQ